jgi:hypothetical protein
MLSKLEKQSKRELTNSRFDPKEIEVMNDLNSRV